MFDGKHLVAMGTSINGLPVEIPMPADAKLWSPDSPFLYQMEVSLISAGETGGSDKKLCCYAQVFDKKEMNMVLCVYS